jgi:AhpD family alkylhydroperoxidase
MASQRIQERAHIARRCAWCLRFHVNDAWVHGRRRDDERMLPATTHTICDDCVARLRRQGLSV